MTFGVAWARYFVILYDASKNRAKNVTVEAVRGVGTVFACFSFFVFCLLVCLGSGGAR